MKRGLWELRFDVARCIRYHDFKRAKYMLIGKACDLVVLVGSSGAVVALVGSSGSTAALWMAVIAAIAGAVNIVFSVNDRYSQYSQLKSRYDVLQDRTLAPDANERIDELRREYANIEKDEPPVSASLNALMHERTCEAFGVNKEGCPSIGRWGRVMAYLF